VKGQHVHDGGLGIAPWRLLTIAVVAIAGIGAVVLVQRQSTDEARREQEALATEVAVIVEGTAVSSVSALAGAGGLATPSEGVDLDSFRAFAREVVDVTPLDALAFEPVVLDDERAAFEEALGSPILEMGDDGELVPAEERQVYFPVQEVVPSTEENGTVLGFDLLSDPVRGGAAATARDTGRAVLTEPVRSATDDEVSYFVVKPLYESGPPLDTVAQRRAAHIGFLSTVYAGSNFTEILLEQLPPGIRYSLHDGDALLAATDDLPSGGARRPIDVGGRRWVLVVEDEEVADRSLAVAIALMTALAVGGLLFIFWRDARHERVVRDSARVIARTADVAQALAAAGTVEEVEFVIRHQVPAVLGSKGASLGLVDRDAGVLRQSASPAIDPEVTARWSEIPLEQRVPITEVVRTGEPLLLRTREDWRAHSDTAVITDVERAGLVSAACLPLGDRHGEVTATLAMSWDREVVFDAPTLDTLRTVTELCEYTLDRARSTDRAAHAALGLARLAGRLATATTIGEVLESITEAASSPVGASATSVGLIDHDAGVLRTHHGPSVEEAVRRRFTDPPIDAPLAFTDAARTGLMVLLGDHDEFAARYPESAASTGSLGFGARAALPMRDSEGTVVGAIVHAWPGPRHFDETLVSTLLTIADMAAQALERTHLAEAEHDLVTNLQDSVLVPLPSHPHLDIAARYLPSVADIGMGGDWYEGIAIDDHRYALIMGDVAGHGITAVGDMAQLRAVVGALVRLGTPLADVFPQATTLLQAADHNPTASSLLVVIDTDTHELSYTAAGHPPPVVRAPDGEVTVLEEGRQPILGITIDERATATWSFPPGSTLVAYTDGLIERRGEPIDVSLTKLEHCVSVSHGNAETVADAVLDACLNGREPDDDVALVVISQRSE
jgi:serine phosphatase RsbU (regulator of sigma subunit)/CHASE1-domain containing sensor protein